MASRELKVNIVGDPSSLNRALGSATKSSEKFGSSLGRSMQHVGKSMTIAGAAITGVAVVLGKKLVDSALAAEVSQTKLEKSFENAGLSAEKYAKQIKGAEDAGRELGFTNTETRDSLAKLVQGGDSVKKSMTDIALAQDYARVSGKDLAGATSAIVKVHQGLLRPLKELGISLPQVTSHMDALKAAAKENKTAIDLNAKAFAFQQDKIATGAQAIDLMTQKLHGQAEAFSRTSAGGMAAFQAQLENLQETIGALLLPFLDKAIVLLNRLTDVLAGLSPHTQKLIVDIGLAVAAFGAVMLVLGPVIAGIGTLLPIIAALASPLGIAVVGIIALSVALAAAVLWPDKLQKALETMGLTTKQSKETVDSLRNAFTAIKAVVDAVWPSIEKIIVPALKVIQGILMVVSALLRGDFSEAWKGIKVVVANEVKFMLAIVTAMPRIIGQAALAIGKAAIEGIGKGAASAWPAVAGWFSALPGKILGYFKGAAGWLYNIGGEIINGLAAGIRDAAVGVLQSAISYVTGLIPDVIKRHLGISSPSKVTIEIGKQIAEGLGVGFGLGMVKVRDELGTKIQSAIDHMIAAVQAKQGAFGSAFDALVSSALEAFDKLAEGIKTKTEKLIARQDAQRAAQALRDALTSAQGSVAEAKGRLEAPMTPLTQNKGESDEDFQKRQLDAQEQFLADKEQALRDYNSALADQKEAEFQIQRAADEKRATAERAKLDEQTALRRRHFDEQLKDLQQSFLDHEITIEEFNKKLTKLFGKYHVPIKDAAKGLGAAMGEGLLDSLGAVREAARQLADTIAKELRKMVITVSVVLAKDDSGGNPSHRASGGSFRRGQRLLVGERGPELVTFGSAGTVTPNNALGTGSGGINVNFNGPVYGSPRDIAIMVRNELSRMGGWNGGGMLGNAV